MKLSEVIHELRQLGQARTHYWETELPKIYPRYPLIYPGEPEEVPGPDEIRMRQFAQSLPIDVLNMLEVLVDLMWRKIEPADIGSRFREYQQRYTDHSYAVNRLMRHGMLELDLEDSLEILADHGIDVDSLLDPVVV
jgi:hypothetical protein